MKIRNKIVVSYENQHKHLKNIKYKSKQKGITLVSLVVTIIVVLILIGVTLGAVSSKNGIINRAEEAREGAEIAKYKELIQEIIVEKQVERSRNRKKPKALIEMVAEGIDEKDWAVDVKICDDDENEITPPSQGTKILVETVDEYEIIVDMATDPITIDGIPIKPGASERYTVMFDANGGSGTLPGEITKRPGRKFTLPSGTGLSKTERKLVGWSEEPLEDGATGKYYGLGTEFTPTKSMTVLYAVWAEDIVEITFNGNNATSGTMNKMPVIRGRSTTLASNKFARTNYKFKGWNTQPNGTGTNYTDGASITVTNDITLYAMWEEIIVLKSISPTSADVRIGEYLDIVASSNYSNIDGSKVKWSTTDSRNSNCKKRKSHTCCSRNGNNISMARE